MNNRPIALITGASRAIGIGSSIAAALAKSGWNIAITYWCPYDKAMPWGSRPADINNLTEKLKAAGAQTIEIEADLSLTETPSRIFDTVENNLGKITALVMAHAHSVDSDIFSTTVESFDMHFAVNTRATWLLIKEFGSRFTGVPGTGRIISLTSDHTAGNLPYGASKGAMDRIVIAAATEFRNKGITANAINPGAIDNGWMSKRQKAEIKAITLSGRIGTPNDTSNLITFLCSADGGWINGQLLHSNGGIQ